MKCRDGKPFSAFALFWLMLAGYLILTTTPSARADLVEEVEDLERQGRPERQTVPGVSATPTAPRPATNDPGVEQSKAKTAEKSGSKTRGDKQKKAANRSPVLFESKNLQAMKDQGEIVLKEEVIITQSDFRLEADEATIYFDQKTREAVKVIASGRVKAFKEDQDLKERVKAECHEAVFYSQERKMILRGNAKLWRGADLIRGKKIIYDLDTGRITAERIEGVVQPGGKK